MTCRASYFSIIPAQDLVFLRCLDQDCTNTQTTTISSNSNGMDSPTIVIGADGLARITYINYNSPNELHYVVCHNDDCASNTDTISVVAT